MQVAQKIKDGQTIGFTSTQLNKNDTSMAICPTPDPPGYQGHSKAIYNYR